jgi:septal ring factor EnvC (AmiA/AmiB activator)
VEVSKKNEVINKQNEIVDVYNGAVTEFNEGTNDLNAFIEYRNKQFTPAKTDAQIKDMLQTAEQKMNRAEATIKSIVGKYDKLDGMIATMDKSMKQANAILNEQKDFLKKYLSKGKVERKFMFVKLTKGG